MSPAYLDQKLIRGLEPGRSLVDEVRSIRPDLTIEGARDALARYRFLGEDVFKTVAALSGGERCRLALLKVSLEPRNLLVFDEPTNHLDIPAREVLERALARYDGTLIVVSHDRAFLDQAVKKILWVEGGTVRIFEGNYSAARRKLRSTSEEAAESVNAAEPAREPVEKPSAEAEPPPPKRGAVSREDSRRRRSRRQKARNRLKQVEDDIAQFEERSKELQEALAKDPGGDWEKLNLLANEEQELRGRLERRYAEWERLTAELEAAD